MNGWRSRRSRREVKLVAEVSSSLFGTHFIATFTGCWRPIAKLGHSDTEINAVVKGNLVSECENITRGRLLTEPLGTQALVNSSLQQRRTIAPYSIEMWGNASLRVDHEDLDIAREYQASKRKLQRQPDREPSPIEDEVDLREVFSNEADAKLWWIRHHPDKLEAIGDDGVIANLITVVKDEKQEHQLETGGHDNVLRVLADFLKQLNSPDEISALTTAFIRILGVLRYPELEKRMKDASDEPYQPQTSDTQSGSVETVPSPPDEPIDQ